MLHRKFQCTGPKRKKEPTGKATKKGDIKRDDASKIHETPNALPATAGVTIKKLDVGEEETGRLLDSVNKIEVEDVLDSHQISEEKDLNHIHDCQVTQPELEGKFNNLESDHNIIQEDQLENFQLASEGKELGVPPVTHTPQTDTPQPDPDITPMSPIIPKPPPSLTNMGATCYLNSAFQGISSCDTFVNEISDLCNRYIDGEVKQLHVFKELIDILNGCSKSRMEIARNPIFRNWNKPDQQGSYELLAHAMNQVYNELRKHLENTMIIPKRDLKRWLQEKLPMRFIIQYTIVCGCGEVTSSPLQSDLALHVTIPGNQRRCKLNDLVHLYFGEDPIEDYECDLPNCDGRGTKRIARLCQPLPHTICIHLQRTFWNGYSMTTIDKRIDFDTTLTIKPEYWSQLPKPPPEEKVVEVDTYLEQENAKLTKEPRVEGNEPLIVHQSGDKESENAASTVEPQVGEKESENVESAIEPQVDDKESENAASTIEPQAGETESENATSTVEPQVGGKESENAASTIEHIVEGGLHENHVDDKEINTSNEKPEDEKEQKYDLVSVIVNSGTVYGGHYICYKKVGSQWFLTNDSWVHEVDEDEVLRCQAYILFYEQPYLGDAPS